MYKSNVSVVCRTVRRWHFILAVILDQHVESPQLTGFCVHGGKQLSCNWANSRHWWRPWDWVEKSRKRLVGGLRIKFFFFFRRSWMMNFHLQLQVEIAGLTNVSEWERTWRFLSHLSSFLLSTLDLWYVSPAPTSPSSRPPSLSLSLPLSVPQRTN